MQPNVVLTRRDVLGSCVAAGMGTLLQRSAAEGGTSATQEREDREFWLDLVERVSEPVLQALSKRQLRATMPVESAPGENGARAVGTHLEATGRLLAGLAPWLELSPAQDGSAGQTAGESARETKLRERYREWALAGIESAVDPQSPDYMRFGDSSQTLVDSSFLALALLRAPKQLMARLGGKTRARLIDALERQRAVQPPFNNWLLFAAMNEAALEELGARWDKVRVDYALRQHEAWYLGDGTYGDGPHFHADFYNSYVIQPYLLQLLDTVGDKEQVWKVMRATVAARAARYAAIQERMISPSGEFPVLGRSITYRAGAFHLLADAARRQLLPSGISPQQVRGALAAVQRRTLLAAGTFSETGWLQIGLAGHQPSLGETYISTGSLYLCSASWLPLGRPATDVFWTGPGAEWTQKALWEGKDRVADHAISE